MISQQFYVINENGISTINRITGGGEQSAVISFRGEITLGDWIEGKPLIALVTEPMETPPYSVNSLYVLSADEIYDTGDHTTTPPAWMYRIILGTGSTFLSISPSSEWVATRAYQYAPNCALSSIVFHPITNDNQSSPTLIRYGESCDVDSVNWLGWVGDVAILRQSDGTMVRFDPATRSESANYTIYLPLIIKQKGG